MIAIEAPLVPDLPTGTIRMYAIAFDLDTETLQRTYAAPSWRHAYSDIRRILNDEGFAWQQGSVNFGLPDRVDAVACVLAIQRLARELPWFSASARDVRMLRIEENNDLRPAIESGGPLSIRPRPSPGSATRPSRLAARGATPSGNVLSF
jgi:virulence-associated protein VapD